MNKTDCPADNALRSDPPIDAESGPGRPGNRGFTLIELMIVVAIVGILAAIAYPGYQWALQRSYKTEAKTNLTSLALLLEQHRSIYGCYGQRAGGACPTTVTTYTYTEDDAGAASANTITAWLNFNPHIATEAVAIRYDYGISAGDNVTPPVYTVTATPVTSRGAAAGNLTLTQAGVKRDGPDFGWK